MVYNFRRNSGPVKAENGDEGEGSDIEGQKKKERK
jgi:hypothetical protein